MKRQFAIGLCAICWGAIAHAATESAGELHTACAAALQVADGKSVSDEDMNRATFCVGYLAGITDMVGVWMSSVGPRRTICFPANGISNEQSIRIVVKWLRAHPEQWTKPARTEVFIALGTAFPCEPK